MALVKKIKGGKPTRTKTRRTREHDEDEDIRHITLPTQKIQVPKELSSYSICLFGEKGIGKTSLIGQFPNHLNIQFDPRRVNVSLRQLPGPDDKPLTWAAFRKIVELIQNRQESGRMTVGVDIVYRAYELCLLWVCQQIDKSITHPQQMNDYGKTWKDVETEFENQLGLISQADCQLITIAHAAYKEVPLRTGSNYELLVPQASKGVWGYLRAMDYVFYYGYSGRQRILQVRGDDFTWASAGVENTYLDPKGREVRRYKMPNTAKEAYRVLIDGFHNRKYGMREEEELQDEVDNTEGDTRPKKATKKVRKTFKKR